MSGKQNALNALPANERTQFEALKKQNLALPMGTVLMRLHKAGVSRSPDIGEDDNGNVWMNWTSCPSVFCFLTEIGNKQRWTFTFPAGITFEDTSCSDETFKTLLKHLKSC